MDLLYFLFCTKHAETNVSLTDQNESYIFTATYLACAYSNIFYLKLTLRIVAVPYTQR